MRLNAAVTMDLISEGTIFSSLINVILAVTVSLISQQDTIATTSTRTVKRVTLHFVELRVAITSKWWNMKSTK